MTTPKLASRDATAGNSGGAGAGGGALWITRMVSPDYDEEVATIGYRGDGAARTFSHALRVFKHAARTGSELATGDLLVTLLDANGDSGEEDPLTVPASQADWFLDTWLKVPKSWRAKTPARSTR